MLNLIREFRFGRPQRFAALLLVALSVLLLVRAGSFDGSLLSREPSYESRSYMQVFGTIGDPPVMIPSDSILLQRSVRLARPIAEVVGSQVGAETTHPSARFAFWRLPFVLFCIWLAAALWWVTRRLYNDRGAFVALGLFCFSLPMITAGSRINADIIAAWGLYGLIYTAIGVAHTLYAPPHKWRPRIVLLGVALGVTAGAHFAAAIVGLVLAAAFMLYLGPGRRVASLAILAMAAAIALVMLAIFYGCDLHALLVALRARPVWGFHFAWPNLVILAGQTWLLAVLTIASFILFTAWRWTRYFGNIAPLIAALILFAVATNNHANSAVWALPFVFTFIGGIMSDLLESPRGNFVSVGLWAVMVAYAGMALGGVFFG